MTNVPDTQTNEITLVSCPFCGADRTQLYVAKTYDGVKIGCLSCSAQFLLANHFGNDKEAVVSAWNTRAEHQKTDPKKHFVTLVETLEDVLRWSDDTVWVGDAETLVDRMVALGIYGQEVYDGQEPWGGCIHE